MNQSKTTTHGAGSLVTLIVLGTMAMLLLLFTCAVLSAVQEHVIADTASSALRAVKLRNELPQSCAQFYNDGTDQWIECIGVGRR